MTMAITECPTAKLIRQNHRELSQGRRSKETCGCSQNSLDLYHGIMLAHSYEVEILLKLCSHGNAASDPPLPPSAATPSSSWRWGTALPISSAHAMWPWRVFIAAVNPYWWDEIAFHKGLDVRTLNGQRDKGRPTPFFPYVAKWQAE